MADNAKRTGAALEAHYQFLLWLGPTLEKLPKSHKFTLGDRIQSLSLTVPRRARASQPDEAGGGRAGGGAGGAGSGEG